MNTDNEDTGCNGNSMHSIDSGISSDSSMIDTSPQSIIDEDTRKSLSESRVDLSSDYMSNILPSILSPKNENESLLFSNQSLFNIKSDTVINSLPINSPLPTRKAPNKVELELQSNTNNDNILGNNEKLTNISVPTQHTFLNNYNREQSVTTHIPESISRDNVSTLPPISLLYHRSPKITNETTSPTIDCMHKHVPEYTNIEMSKLECDTTILPKSDIVIDETSKLKFPNLLLEFISEYQHTSIDNLNIPTITSTDDTVNNNKNSNGYDNINPFSNIIEEEIMHADLLYSKMHGIPLTGYNSICIPTFISDNDHSSLLDHTCESTKQGTLNKPVLQHMDSDTFQTITSYTEYTTPQINPTTNTPSSIDYNDKPFISTTNDLQINRNISPSQLNHTIDNSTNSIESNISPIKTLPKLVSQISNSTSDVNLLKIPPSNTSTTKGKNVVPNIITPIYNHNNIISHPYYRDITNSTLAPIIIADVNTSYNIASKVKNPISISFNKTNLESQFIDLIKKRSSRVLKHSRMSDIQGPSKKKRCLQKYPCICKALHNPTLRNIPIQSIDGNLSNLIVQAQDLYKCDAIENIYDPYTNIPSFTELLEILLYQSYFHPNSDIYKAYKAAYNLWKLV